MPIIVNKIEITDDEVHSEMQYHPASSIDTARDFAAQALVVRELLFQEAVNLELTDFKSTKDASEEEISNVIDKLITKEVSIPIADRDTCLRYYEQHSQLFKDKKTESILPFDLVEKHIQDYLHAKAMRTAISQYIEKLARHAKIAGFNLFNE